MDEAIRGHDEYADNYDLQAKEYKWYAHHALFGLVYEFVNREERLLDIGIGTGLSSSLFAKAGLEIYGFDGSPNMLKVCKSKKFAEDLKLLDIRNKHWPYSENFFHHIISCGVFNFFGDLASIFKEVARIIKPEGFFTFMIKVQRLKIVKGEKNRPKNDDYIEYSIDGIKVFEHSNEYIERICQYNKFNMLKMLKFLAWSNEKDVEEPFFIYVIQKM